MTNLSLRYAARSDVGLVRRGNEDSGYAGGHMLVVADGMGGHAAGELASATVIATFAELDRQPPGEDVLAALADAVADAHDALAAIVAASPDVAGMGTTITAMAWEANRIGIAHIGDSRAYLLRNGQLFQLTVDHTFVQTLVDQGRISKAEAAVHSKRNLLVRALDGVHVVEPDLSIREAELGDRFLLCTDGLSGTVAEPDIRAVLAQHDPTGAVTALVDMALEAGAPDNVTCVVADVVATPEQASALAASVIPAPNSVAEPLSPVVVGAAAEPRNRQRLPGLAFPIDSQPDPDLVIATPAQQPSRTDDADAQRPSDEPSRPGRARWLVVLVGSVLVLVAAAASGYAIWSQHQYYVGDDNGYVAIYQGVPIGTGPHGWSHPVETTNTAVSSLPKYSREQVAQTIPTTGLDESRVAVTRLQAEAITCQTRPQPGCPNYAAATTNVGPS